MDPDFRRDEDLKRDVFVKTMPVIGLLHRLETTWDCIGEECIPIPSGRLTHSNTEAIEAAKRGEWRFIIPTGVGI
jgi:hypothetical protein